MPIEPPRAASAYPFTDSEEERICRDRASAFVGTGKKVAAQINALAEDHGIDEIAVVTWAHDEEARRLSYQLLAEECDLQPL